MITKFNAEFIEEVRKLFPEATIEECSFHNSVGAVHGYRVAFPNQFVASIQFGPGHYGSNHDAILTPSYWESAPPEPYCETAYEAEIAGWYGDGGLVMFDGWEDTVKGYQKPAEVLAWLKEHSNEVVSEEWIAKYKQEHEKRVSDVMNYIEEIKDVLHQTEED